MRRRRCRRRAMWGTAIVETALVAPAIIVLAGGAGQVGGIAYGQVSVDSAAREGARVATEYPSRSLDFVASLGSFTYSCGQSLLDTLTERSVCDAVRSAAGLLSGSQLTVSVTVSNGISRLPQPLRLAGNSCPGGALASGVVSNLPSGVVATISSPSRASAGTVTSDSTGAYSICLSAPTGSQGTQTTSITATAVDAQGCVYNASVSVSVTTSKTVTPSPADMTLPATGTCPTAPPASTPTPTPSPTPTPTAPPSGTLPTPPPAPSCSTVVADTSYVQVTVSYAVPVFVPFVNRLFENPTGSGTRVVTSSERMQVEPCTITQGG